MPEVPNSGGNHGDLVFIRHFDDGFIRDGPAGLDDSLNLELSS